MDFQDIDFDLGGSDGGNAAEITRLATGLAEARQRIKDLENENEEIGKRFKHLACLEGKAPEMEAEIKMLKNERDRLKTELDAYKKRMDGFAARISEELKPFDTAMQAFSETVKKMRGIDESAKEMEAYKVQLKKTAEQGDGSGIGKKDIFGIVLIALLLYGFSYFGTKHGSPAMTLEQINDMTWRLIYNQVYVPLGEKPITPYMSRDEATKIINNQFQFEQEKWRQQTQEQEEQSIRLV